MNTDLFDELEMDLRAALHAVVPHLLDDEPSHVTAHVGEAASLLRTTAGTVPIVRQRARVGTMAAALVLLVGAGAAVLALGHHNPGVASTPTGATDTSPSKVDCSQGVCLGFDRLPLAAGVGNVFVGPADLGKPQFERELYDRLTRCVELDTTFTECTKVEGVAGVNVVSYPGNIDVGTVFTDVTPQQYASISDPGKTSGLAAAVVRGHDGIRGVFEGRASVMWQEAQGMLVWVGVPATEASRLLTIAEGVRANPDPPTSIQRIVQVHIDGATATGPAAVRTEPTWDARDNNGRGLLVGTAGTTECVGYEYIRSCGQAIGDRTFVSTARAADGVSRVTVVAGATPPDVRSVRISLADGRVATASTVAFANTSSRFYDVEIAGSLTGTVEWLDAGGQVVAATTATSPTTVPARPTLPPGISDPQIGGTNSGCGVYSLRKGDLPQSVADRFGITLEALAAANKDNPGYAAFYQGAVINIPLGAVSSLCTPTT